MVGALLALPRPLGELLPVCVRCEGEVDGEVEGCHAGESLCIAAALLLLPRPLLLPGGLPLFLCCGRGLKGCEGGCQLGEPLRAAAVLLPLCPTLLLSSALLLRPLLACCRGKHGEDGRGAATPSSPASWVSTLADLLAA